MRFRPIILFLLLIHAPLEAGQGEEKSLRIVSLSPAISRMLFEIGQVELIVGMTRYCKLPLASAEAIPQVGGAIDPEIETIILLQPDMVIGGSLLPATTRQKFEQMGIEVKTFRQDHLDDILDQVTWLGTYTGAEARAQRAVSRARNLMNELKQTHSEKAMSAILVFSEELTLAAGANTYGNEVMQLSGFRNIAESLKQSWPIISSEWLLVQDPEWILVASDVERSEVDKVKRRYLAQWRQHPIFSQLAAVQNENIIVIPENALTVPSLRVFEVMEDLNRRVK